MDLLRKELERKKKALVAVKSGAPRYIRAGELRRKQLEEEENLKRSSSSSALSPSLPSKKAKIASDGGEKYTKIEESSKPSDRKGKDGQETTISFSPKVQFNSHVWDDEIAHLGARDVTEKLRMMGLPVRLFGEVLEYGDDSRRNRLREALDLHNQTLDGLKEKDEFRLEKGHSIRNTFLEKDKSEEIKTNQKNEDQPKKDDFLTDQTLPTEPHKRVYKYFKGLLRQWEDDLSKRPDEVKRSVAGKNETKTMQQCRDYISALFRLCKKRQVEEGQLQNIVKIVNFCVEGEFVKAHDAYMDVAIGRAAWPIGVTMVGIHARTGRSKIESSNVAHVMNSELQRKYLTSIKRLMTYAQSKRPDIHPSKKVVN